MSKLKEPEAASLHNGEALDPNDCALIWNPKTGWRLLLPEISADEHIDAREVLALGAMIMALRKDPSSVGPLAEAMEKFVRDIEPDFFDREETTLQ